MKWRIIAPASNGFYRAAGYLKSGSTASPNYTYSRTKVGITVYRLLHVTPLWSSHALQ